jgi:hypothetical protein
MGAFTWHRLPPLAPVAEPGIAHVPVDCSALKSKRLMVAVVFGQSNAANHGESPRRAANGVYSYYRGRCYEARDPLPGASGSGGSVWTRLGDAIVASGMFEAVLFVPLGVESTRIDQWAAGALQDSLAAAIRMMNEQGFSITHLLWHQGEADAKHGTAEADYRRSFGELLDKIRSYGVTAPIYVSVATRCGTTQSDAIRRAQQMLVDRSQGIFPGPDTDALDDSFRIAGCHFSDRGLARAAALWFDRLTDRQ